MLAEIAEKVEQREKFEESLSRIPLKWRGAIVDVFETFEIVKQGLLLIDIDDPFVLTEAVRMTIERHDNSSEGDERLVDEMG
ncbi:MAG: hypothetical protein EHM87_25400 [Burkholderiales bacterium]|nr:MAG: hypothetical protein EHM87_25400 [Burkholderiales bacterium]